MSLRPVTSRRPFFFLISFHYFRPFLLLFLLGKRLSSIFFVLTVAYGRSCCVYIAVARFDSLSISMFG